MKNIPENNENNTINDSYNNKYEQVTDTLLKSKGGHKEFNNDLENSNELNETISMGHKSRCSHRNYLKKHVGQESRSQSLPNSLDVKKTNGYTSDSCDTQLKLLPENESPPESPTSDLWFKTWPERNKNIEPEEISSSKNVGSTKNCDNNRSDNCKQNTFTFNEALQSISLAYSPVTKQLHYVQKNDNEITTVEEDIKSKLGHRRNEAGSFSSTVSSLSDPSPSGSLLDADERIPSPESGAKYKKKGLSSFFNRLVYRCCFLIKYKMK